MWWWFYEYFFWFVILLVVAVPLVLFFGIYKICVVVSDFKINDRHKEINHLVGAELKKSGFTISSIYALCDSASAFGDDDERMWIFVDKTNSKIGFIDYDLGKLSIVNFKDIINYEIYRNGGMISNGVGMAAMPAIGLFAATTSQLCHTLNISIRINDVNKPHVSYNFIRRTFLNRGLKTNKEDYEEIITSLQKFVSFLEMVINSNKQNQNNQQKIENPTN